MEVKIPLMPFQHCSQSPVQENQRQTYEEMQNFLTNYYNNVMKDAEAPTLDLGVLRKEIGGIKGVGEKRLDEIMAVIERHLGV